MHGSVVAGGRVTVLPTIMHQQKRVKGLYGHFGGVQAEKESHYNRNVMKL